MALLLSVETSTQDCSVALHSKGKLIASRQSQSPRSAASQLAVMIDEVIKSAGHKTSALQGVIVSSGPGSYTGLRIGVATAKGICYALNIPLVAVHTLDVMTQQAREKLHLEGRDTKALLCPMLDARRMEVYCMISRAGNVVEPVQAKVIDENSFENYLREEPIFFFGEGAEKCKNIIRHPNAQFLDGIVPDARTLGELGFVKWNQQEVEDLAAFEPFYLKDFVFKKPNLN